MCGAASMTIMPGPAPRCSAPSAAIPTGRPPGVTPHVLQFCASQLYPGGMDLVAIQQAPGHARVATTMNYIDVHATRIEDARVTGQERAAQRLQGLPP